MKFYEVNQEDDELQVEITNERESEWCMAVKKSLRTTVADAMLEQIMTVVTAMKSKDGDDAKAAQDKIDKAK